jgi:hypothetical protein
MGETIRRLIRCVSAHEGKTQERAKWNFEVPKGHNAPSNETEYWTNESLEMSTNLGRDILESNAGLWPVSSELGWERALEQQQDT